MNVLVSVGAYVAMCALVGATIWWLERTGRLEWLHRLHQRSTQPSRFFGYALEFGLLSTLFIIGVRELMAWSAQFVGSTAVDTFDNGGVAAGVVVTLHVIHDYRSKGGRSKLHHRTRRNV